MEVAYEVTVINRRDCCSDFLSNATLKVFSNTLAPSRSSARWILDFEEDFVGVHDQYKFTMRSNSTQENVVVITTDKFYSSLVKIKQEGILTLSNIAVLGRDGSPVAVGKVEMSREFIHPLENCVDGNTTTLCTSAPVKDKNTLYRGLL